MSLNALHFELASPEKCFFSGEVESVILPAESGEMTVFVNHDSVLTTIKPGIITVGLSFEDVHRYVVLGGVCGIVSSRCTVLSETILLIDGSCLTILEGRIDEVRSSLDNIYDVDQRSQMEQFLTDLSYLHGKLQ
ncbi:F0F1 ATP synthase subunit epsilon [Candidatus Liberibacter africanus]|uniref:ATP synthase epsilon chain n=1 Tax=Candidatus Liberibacter africanus PTSAPSY TaxID=1277257 RepID=A0A0G3I6Y1_LIBAF|nr:F0F1 ATP synthase subunit epsilon [Candidatus Liberibacter africanus]AKK20293.1 ATP synthase F0F1 subunit epsilon [Candidatus Liberibacter africanus PTSAPSY]QTP64049.1 F0F1 ATP synthase subunit epsilon [Candidatus Liberibacter africanus]